MNFLRIAWRDISSIFKNRFIRVSVVGIIIVPLLYSLLYLAAFWDPYSRLTSMPVAVVNLDEGSTKDSSPVNYGDDVVKNLKDNSELGWKFVSLKDAQDGVKGSKYYSMFVIPKDFSKNVLSAKDGKPQQPKILYKSNDGKNFLAAQIGGKVEVLLKAEISKTITKEYTQITFDNLYDVKDGFKQAADGSKQLSDGLVTAKDGSTQIMDGLGTLNGKVPELKDGIGQLYSGAKQMSDGINTTALDSQGNPVGLNSGISALQNGVNTAKDGAASLNTGASQLLNGSKTLGAGVVALNNAVNVGSVTKPSLKYGVTLLYNAINNTDPAKGLGAGVAALNDAVNVGSATQPSLKTGISMVYDGVTNSDPTKGLSAGVTALNNAVNVGSATQPSLVAGVTSVNNGVALLSNTVKSLNDLEAAYNNPATSETDKQKYLAQIMAIIPQLNTAVNVDVSATKPSLKTGVGMLYNGITDSTSGLSAGVTALNTAVNVDVSATKPSLKTGISMLYNGITDPTKGLSAGVTVLNSAVNVGSTAQPSLKAGISMIYDGVTNADPTKGLSAGVTALNNAVNVGSATQPSVINGMKALTAGTTDLSTGMSQISDATSKIGTGVTSLAGGSTQLANGLGTLSGKIPELSDGVSKLYTGSKDLNDGMTKLNDGSKELSDKLADGSDKINKNLVNSSSDMATFVSEPLKMSEQPINPVKNYGTGFTPYFIPLSLWVGAIMMFFVITDKVDNSLNASSASVVAGKFLSYGYIGIMQAVLVSTVVLCLGLKPQNYIAYYLFNILMSYVFIAIIQCLIFLLGDPGRLIAIAILILQLTSCAGTFPLEVVPKFFKVLNPYMPFTYCVSALREIISGGNYAVVWKDVAILACVMFVFLFISMVMKGHADKMQELIEKKKEEEAANIA